MKEFLSKHRSEVTKVLLTEYDAKKQRKMDMRDAREEGRAEGRLEGRNEGRLEGHAEAQEQLFRLMKLMQDAGEGDQIIRLANDPEFFARMREKYL